MRHQKARGKLSRDSAHRKALMMNLSKEIIAHERIRTTEAKAKAVKPEIERLITLAKRGDLHARRQALSTLAQDKFAVYKLFEELALGVDDATWLHHLRRGDYSRWFREELKDEELASEAQQVEKEAALEPAESRKRILAAIDRRYAPPERT